MVALDATIVNVALPTAQRALGFDDAHRSYVVTAYTLSFAGLLLLGGKVSDRIGRRRALTIGLVGFALSSALAGAAPSFEVLVLGRALQGASAAFMAPAALALIASTFTEPRERGRAFGVFGAVASSGAVVGLLLGGVLTEYVGWRWCLYVNVLVAVAVLTIGRRVLPADDGFPVPVDVVSGLLATAGLAGLVLGAGEAAAHGWTSVRVLVPGLVGVALIATFLLRQRALAAPLLPLSILRDRGRATAYAATAISVVGIFGMFLMLTYHFQAVLGYSPVRTGLAFLPMSVAVAGSSYGIASRLMDRVAGAGPGGARVARRGRRAGTADPADPHQRLPDRDPAGRGARRPGHRLRVHAVDRGGHERGRPPADRRRRGHRQHRDADRK